MLTLRLARAGTKKRPVYHLVATSSRNRRDGRFVEKLGFFNPSKDVLVLDHARVQYWIGVGATLSETVKSLVKRSQSATPAAQAPSA